MPASNLEFFPASVAGYTIKASGGDTGSPFLYGIGGLLALCLRAEGLVCQVPLLLQAPVPWGLEHRLLPPLMRRHSSTYLFRHTFHRLSFILFHDQVFRGRACAARCIFRRLGTVLLCRRFIRLAQPGLAAATRDSSPGTRRDWKMCGCGGATVIAPRACKNGDGLRDPWECAGLHKLLPAGALYYLMIDDPDS
ncbi:MAG TPA: hypothetical protein VNA16_05890 [Abditibacteriaceae bacterium]|nr:hypothetical protein [Abditibacteriaceae bacterium]